MFKLKKSFLLHKLSMATPISLFDYNLPQESIAQKPVEPRDHSKLLVLNFEEDKKTSLLIEHCHFFNIIDYLKAGDVLVMNDTKVFRARLKGIANGREVEVFLLPPVGVRLSTFGGGDGGRGEEHWSALLKPGRKIKVGDTISFGEIFAKVLERFSDGRAFIKFFPSHGRGGAGGEGLGADEVLAFTNKRGEIPVPPYVKKVPDKIETYQTVYARENGSVAAPTAGFHFTPELLQKIKEKGIDIQFVTLHVGLGTFRPVKSETLEEHEMHSEFVEIKPEVAQVINKAKSKGQRIVAVGTTTTRALEGAFVKFQIINSKSQPPNSKIKKVTYSINHQPPTANFLPTDGFIGEVNLFITPGFKFNVVDALITNFHLPKSTLLVLVSAFAGRENILAAYEEAIKLGYRFYSFGDAMFIGRKGN